jgi:hypothetical protein
MVGALSLVQSNLDIVSLRFQARNEQMIQSVETAGSPLYFSRQPRVTKFALRKLEDGIYL